MNTLTLTSTTQRPRLHVYARVLATQLLFLTPLLWLLELSQNQAWRLVNGTWGWIYPDSPYHWFSFKSMILWAGCVWLLWTLYFFVYHPRRLSFWTRTLLSTVACWGGEWLGGFLSVELTGKHLQVWPGTLLVYVSFPALFFWLSNVVVYHLLTVYVVDLTPDYDAPADT